MLIWSIMGTKGSSLAVPVKHQTIITPSNSNNEQYFSLFAFFNGLSVNALLRDA